MVSATSGRRVGLLACMLSLCLLATAPALQSPGKADGARLRGLNGGLLRLVSQLPQMAPENASALREEIRSLARQRREVLEALVQERPAEAASLAFPDALAVELVALAPELASELETYGTWQGTLEYIVEDDETMARHRNHRRLHTGREVLDLNFSGTEPARLVRRLVRRRWLRFW